MLLIPSVRKRRLFGKNRLRKKYNPGIKNKLNKITTIGGKKSV